MIKNSEKTSQFFFRALDKFFKIDLEHKKIDAIIFSSHSRQNEMPIFAARIQEKFKIKNNIICYDLPGSCSGFTNGLIHASAFLNSGIVKRVLLICADTHSKIAEKKFDSCNWGWDKLYSHKKIKKKIIWILVLMEKIMIFSRLFRIKIN